MIASDPSLRLLERASFGARPGAREALQEQGAEAWLERQLRPEKIGDVELEVRLERLARNELEPGDPEARIGRKPAMSGGTEAGMKRRRQRIKRLTQHAIARRIVRAVHGERELQEVMVDVWANHFSVFAPKGPIGALLDHYENEVLRPHALGRFEDLLIAVAQSPAMLFYLDNVRSGVPGRKGRRFKNAPQGINENYARELLELHTLGVDGGYTQGDIIEVARVLTGWNVKRSDRQIEFKYRRFLHDGEPKRVLGRKVPGSGLDEGFWLLRQLARNPSTARHVSTRLVRRFVADDPPPALVERTAKRFLETAGDIAQVLRVVLLSPELAAPANRKLKTPLELTASALRATGGETDGGQKLRRELGALGELPWFARTPEGFPDRAEEWLDPSSVLARISLAFRLSDGIGATRLGRELPQLALSTTDRLGLDRRERVALAIASPEFQWQ